MNSSFNRRRFLKAIGMSLALPALESIPVASASRLAKAPVKAKRLVCVGANLGLHGPSLFPSETGTNWSLTPLTCPLAQHRES
ncbi:MAG: hypothetical protein MK240_10685, partial [Opitutales bacterium]|nr:hypothetical protein [Opitutales bacterium]